MLAAIVLTLLVQTSHGGTPSVHGPQALPIVPAFAEPGAAGPTASDGGEASADAPEPPGFLRNLIRWLGKFHPPTVNFPIALLIVAALAEVLWAVTEHSGFRFASRFCIWLGALGAVAGALLGWFFAGFRWTDPSWLLTAHRWLGTGAAFWAVLVLVLSEQSHRRNSPRLETTFWAVLFVGAVLVAVTGFFGGAMVYGLKHYAWPSPAPTAEAPPEQQPPGPGSAQAKQEKTQPAGQQAEPALVIQMTDEWTYEPEKATIEAGQTVRWDCGPTSPHTVTADPDKANNPEHVQLPEGAETFDSGLIRPGESFSYTFEVPGFYRYFCIPHEYAGMIGELEVKPP